MRTFEDYLRKLFEEGSEAGSFSVQLDKQGRPMILVYLDAGGPDVFLVQGGSVSPVVYNDEGVPDEGP